MSHSHEFGCHSCCNTLMTLHAVIRQVLAEPAINQERIRGELLSVKRFIEDVVGVGETEVRSVE
jgi:hypothetical protein